MGSRGQRVGAGVGLALAALVVVSLTPDDAHPPLRPDPVLDREVRTLDEVGPTLTTQTSEHTGATAEPPTAATSANAPGRMRGVVLDFETRAPVPGATVYLAESMDSLVSARAAVSTTRSGRFDLAVAAAARVLIVNAPGYQTKALNMQELPPDCEVLVARGESVSGVVQDQFGQPVPNARVFGMTARHAGFWPAVDEWLTPGARGFVTRSDASGRFEGAGLRTGERVVVRARREGYGRDLMKGDVTATAGQRGVALELVACAVITVTFSDAVTGNRLKGMFGRTIAGDASKLLHRAPNGRPLTRERDRAIFSGSYSYCRLVPRDPKTWVPGSDLSVSFSCKRLGYVPRLVIVSAELGTSTEVDIKLQPAQESQWFVANVTAGFPGGRRFSGRLTVRLLTPEGRLDRELRFRDGASDQAIRVPFGRYTVRCFGPRPMGALWNPACARFEWEATTKATFPHLLLRGNPLNLQVVGSDGRRLRVFRVSVRPSGTRSVMPYWDFSGAGDTSDVTEPLWVPEGPRELTVVTSAGPADPVSIDGDGSGSVLDVVVRTRD